MNLRLTQMNLSHGHKMHRMHREWSNPETRSQQRCMVSMEIFPLVSFVPFVATPLLKAL